MKKDNEIIEDTEKQQCESDNAVEEIVAEMLNAYRPVLGDEEPDCELTAQELADTFSENIHLSPGNISMILHKRNFHIKLKGGRFLWQLKLV